MMFEENTLDDLLMKVFKVLVEKPFIVNTTRGNTCEIVGTLLKLNNPRARLSRSKTKGTIFSALGEFIWYMSGSNKLSQIEYYLSKYRDDSEDGETLFGAYGPRLLNYKNNINQIDNIINSLKTNPNTRRAVIQLFDAEDIVNRKKEIPCTCTFQFLIREEKLDLITNMRSNDVF